MPMVILVRHGPAVDLGEGGAFTDELRPLSSEGQEKTRKAARGFSRLGYRPVLSLCSGLVRAHQTEDIFLEELACRTLRRVQLGALRPDGDPYEVLTCLQENPFKSVILFGHNPSMELLFSLFLGAKGVPSVAFRKAGVCVFHFNGKVVEGQGVLECCLTPKALRIMGGESP